MTLPGGVYYIHDFNMSSTATLTFTGPATIYCWHNFTMSGNTTTNLGVPKNLNIIMCDATDGKKAGPVQTSYGRCRHCREAC